MLLDLTPNHPMGKWDILAREIHVGFLSHPELMPQLPEHEKKLRQQLESGDPNGVSVYGSVPNIARIFGPLLSALGYTHVDYWHYHSLPSSRRVVERIPLGECLRPSPRAPAAQRIKRGQAVYIDRDGKIRPADPDASST